MGKAGPSISKSALLLSGCLTWAHPKTKHYDEKHTDTTKRDKGSLFHSLIDSYIKGQAVDLSLISDEEVKLWYKKATVFFDQVLAPRCSTVMSEVAISINWAEGKVEILVGVTGRQYPEKDGWQNGTADLVCILNTGELLIADWKTGGTDGATEQMLSLGCAFQRALETEPDPLVASLGTARSVRIACLKVSEEGVDPDERAVSDDQLANHWLAMEMAWADKDKKNEPVPGIHCTLLYCPHLAYCSAVTGLVEDAAQEDTRLQGLAGNDTILPSKALLRKYRMTDKPRNDEEAGHVMARVSAARRQQKYYESCIREYIANGGRATAGNYEWRETGSGFRWGRLR